MEGRVGGVEGNGSTSSNHEVLGTDSEFSHGPAIRIRLNHSLSTIDGAL